MNRGKFRDLVGSFANRKNLSVEQFNSFIDIARLNLERKFDLTFNLSKITVTYPSVTNVGLALPIAFKSFPHSRAVTMVEPTSGRRVPLVGTTFQTEQRRQSKATVFIPAFDSLSLSSLGATLNTTYYVLTLDGVSTLFLKPEIMGVQLELILSLYLDSYTSDSDEDLILRIGYDALLWETLKVLNVFESDENMIPINESMIQQSMGMLSQYINRRDNHAGAIDLS